MERIPVKSSFIESIGYESGTLEVTFKDGGMYKYIDVPRETYESVMGAESIGKAVRENILKEGFGVEKIEPEVLEIE